MEYGEKIGISIGLPVFNGKCFISSSIDALLCQTHKNFEIIISDNSSTDSTSLICEQYAKRDSRIKYIRQKQNRGAVWNFNFVLKQAKNDFFMWNSVDDIKEPEFLKKTLTALLSNKNAVGCMSKLRYYDFPEKTSQDKINSQFRKIRKKIKNILRKEAIHDISGPYEKKIRLFLRKTKAEMIYGVFYTKELQQCIFDESFIGYDRAIILSLLKHGDLIVVDEVLMKCFEAGLSHTLVFHHAKIMNNSTVGLLFPWNPYTNWCFRNLGWRIFLKNLDTFFLLNLFVVGTQILDIFRVFLIKFLIKK